MVKSNINSASVLKFCIVLSIVLLLCTAPVSSMSVWDWIKGLFSGGKLTGNAVLSSQIYDFYVGGSLPDEPTVLCHFTGDGSNMIMVSCDQNTLPAGVPSDLVTTAVIRDRAYNSVSNTGVFDTPFYLDVSSLEAGLTGLTYITVTLPQGPPYYGTVLYNDWPQPDYITLEEGGSTPITCPADISMPNGEYQFPLIDGIPAGGTHVSSNPACIAQNYMDGLWYFYVDCYTAGIPLDRPLIIPVTYTVEGTGSCVYSVTIQSDSLDADNDGILDNADNCLSTYNPDQFDYELDGIGDVCDACPGCSGTTCCTSGEHAAGIIGPNGGTVATGDGKVTVQIPSGAMNNEKTVSLIQGQSNFAVQTAQGAGTIKTDVQINPDGYQFNSPVTAIFSYAQPANQNQEDRTRIFYNSGTSQNPIWNDVGCVETPITPPATCSNTNYMTCYRDEVNNKLYLYTCHFSEWGAIELEVITTPLTNAITCNFPFPEGGIGTCTSTVSGGNPPYTYQWIMFDQATASFIYLGTSSTLTLTNIPIMYNGNTLRMRVTDATGLKVTSNILTMSVSAGETIPPVITCPANLVVNEGTVYSSQLAYIAVSDNAGTPAVTYQTTGVTITSGVGTMPATHFNAGITTVTYTATDGSGNTATCSFVVTANPIQSPLINSISGPTSLKQGDTYTWNSNPSGGTLPYTYQWIMFDQASMSFIYLGTSSTLTLTNIPMSYNGNTLRMRVTDATGLKVTSNILTMTVTSPTPMTASASVSANPITLGQSATFTATVSGGNPPYTLQWYADGMIIPGAYSWNYIYTPSTVGTHQVYFVATGMSGSPVTSNMISLAVNPVSLQVGVTIAPSANPVSSGTPVTFTAIPVNGGTSPSYQWRVNGARKGTNSPIYSYTPANGDMIACTLTSNLPGVIGNPATSNTVTMTVTSPTIPIATVSANPITLGQSATFTATVSGGNPPYTLQWYADGMIIPGAYSWNYIYTPSTVGTHQVYFVATGMSGSPVTSNMISLAVNPLICPTVSAGLDATITADETYTLQASATDYDSITWTNNANGFVDDEHILNPTYFPSLNYDEGGYMFTITASRAGCPAVSDTMVLTVTSPCTDADTDGYFAEGGSCGVIDCNDLDASINPGASETCDGKDNDCDLQVDEGYIATPTTCGFGPCADSGQLICLDGIETNTCNPKEPTSDANCNGIDDNCNGIVDDGYVASQTECGVDLCASTGESICVDGLIQNTCMPEPEVTFYRDLDMDAFGSDTVLQTGCSIPNGYLTTDQDCNDNDALVNPGANDICTIDRNVIDKNCNINNDGQLDCNDFCGDVDGDGFVTDEKYGQWGGVIPSLICPWLIDAGDCNDNDALVNLNAVDNTCNGIDDNCNGQTDEGYVPQATSCGIGACVRAGQLACTSGTLGDTCTAGAPEIETCNGIDDNCNGIIDDVDADKDGMNDCTVDLCLNSISDNIALNPNQYAQNNFATGAFESGPKNDQSIVYNMQNTKGCTCKQIVVKLGLGTGQTTKGCAPGVMQQWTSIDPNPDRVAGIGKK